MRFFLIFQQIRILVVASNAQFHQAIFGLDDLRKMLGLRCHRGAQLRHLGLGESKHLRVVCDVVAQCHGYAAGMV